MLGWPVSCSEEIWWTILFNLVSFLISYIEGCKSDDASDALLDNAIVSQPSEVTTTPEQQQPDSVVAEQTQESAVVAISSPEGEKKSGKTIERTGVLILDAPGVIARVSPLLIMTVLAIFWPNFKNVVSITGASATSLVNFIFPTLLHLKVFGKSRPGLAVLDVILSLFGIFAAVLGTYMSFIED